MAAPANFELDVLEVQLYIATVSVDIPTTGVDMLHLMECSVQSKPISGAGDNLLDFTLPPSTKAITVFVQSGDAGSNPLIPSTLFKTKDDSDQNLQSIQVTYANESKPSTRWTSEYKDNINYLRQRYLDTQMYSGKFWSEGGAESFPDWLKRGGLYHFSYIRDESDRSTHCQINVQYTNIEPNTNLFVIAHYSRAVQITTQDGFVVDVQSLST